MELKDAQILCEFEGGSHAYGLNTPTSDIDYRGVYAVTDISTIIGLKAGHDETRVKQTDELDSQYFEVRNFLRLLRGGNTQALETVYMKEFKQVTLKFIDIMQERRNLIDSDKLIKVLKGYAQSELRLANGERTGKLGGKRKTALDKYGFSPKNFVQLFRLLWAGAWFYHTGEFPVKVVDFDNGFHEFLMTVKTQPEMFKKEELNKIAASREAKLDEAFESTKIHYSFNEDIANDLCLSIYRPLLYER